MDKFIKIMTKVVALGFVYLIIAGNICIVYAVLGREIPAIPYVMMVVGLVIQCVFAITFGAAKILARLMS